MSWINPFPEIKTPRLKLRQIIPSDLDRVYYGLSHPEVIKFYGVSYDSLEATKEQMQWFTNLENTQTGIWWAICDKDSGTFLGACGFNDLTLEHKKAEVGLWLLPDFWGKGFMSEAMPAICNHAFDKIGLHRIEGFVESSNANCKRAIERLGFTLEGTMKDCEVKEGAFISVDIYAKINS